MAGESRRERVEERFRASGLEVGSPAVLVRVEPKVAFFQVAALIAAGAIIVGVSSALGLTVGGFVLIPAGGLLFLWVQRRKGGMADSFRAAGSGGWLAVTPNEMYTLGGNGEPKCRVARSQVRSAELKRDRLSIVFEDESTRELTIKENEAQRRALAAAF